MHLYLIRHAEAVPAGDPRAGAPGTDDDRPLSDEGRRRFAETVRLLGRMGVRLDGARTSPLARARQTAELLAPILDGDTEIDEGLAWAPGEALAARVRGRSVALVGHEPWTSQHLALLLFGDARAAPPLALSTGSVAALVGEPRPTSMRLSFLLPGRLS